MRAFMRATQKSWTEAAKDIPGAAAAMAELAENEPDKRGSGRAADAAVPLLAGSGTPGSNTEAKWTETIEA